MKSELRDGAAAIAVMVLSLLGPSEAFVINGPGIIQRTGRQQQPQFAYIFGVEENGGTILSPTSMGAPSPPSFAIKGLARSNEARASLARVAAAFPHIGHTP